MVKERHLFPIIALLCIIGSFAASTHIFDILLMLIFGMVGFIMRRRDFAIAPLVLGLVLGGIMDSNFRRAMSLISSSENIIKDLFAKPITLVLLILIVISILTNFSWDKILKTK